MPNFMPATPSSAEQWQIAQQQTQQQQMMMMAQPQFQPINVGQLLNCSSASMNLDQPMAMSNLFDLQATGQNQHLQLMLNSAETPKFGELNFGNGELANADMSMAGISNGIEKANRKSYSAYGSKGCDTLLGIEREQNQTALENIVQGNSTLHHHSDNLTKQNMLIIGAKREATLEGIHAGKEIALKNIDAKVTLGKEIVGMQNNMIDKTFQLKMGQQKLQGEQLKFIHDENREKIKHGAEIVKEIIKNSHEKVMKQMDCAYKLSKEKLRQDHDQKMVTLTDAHTIKIVQQGENKRMKHDYDMLTCNDEKILAHELEKIKLGNKHELEMKKEENENLRANKDKDQQFAMKTARHNLKQMKMQMSAANSPSASRLSFYNGMGQKTPPASSTVKKQMTPTHSANVDDDSEDELDEEEKEDNESVQLESADDDEHEENGDEDDEEEEEDEKMTTTTFEANDVDATDHFFDAKRDAE